MRRVRGTQRYQNRRYRLCGHNIENYPRFCWRRRHRPIPLCPSLGQNMLTSGSSLLHAATEGRLFFGEVTIVVPEGWTCQGVAGTTDVAWDRANLRVGPLHSVFGQNPWTQQPRGCGEPGDFMYFPESFLLENSTLGSRGKCHRERENIYENE